MFTGIIEELGKISSINKRRAAGSYIGISAQLVMSDIKAGDSIAVNGVCLTAIDISSTGFAADVSPETLARTTLGSLQPGSPVNLERSLTPSTRLGGHFVQGHVDGCGTFVSASKDGDFWTMRVGYPADLSRYVVLKGSIAIEGISLTVAGLADGYFEIALIPKTWELTNLSTLKPGSAVNLEVDVIAKYVERILQFKTPKK